jgi:hypothetical protein
VRRATILAAILLAAPAAAQTPDISARRLLSEWNSQEPLRRIAAEMIAAAFASGLSCHGELAGKQVFCSPPGLNGGGIMGTLQRFVADHPDMAERRYGEALAASLSLAFPCHED